MKKKIFALSLFFLFIFSMNGQEWDYFKDVSKYVKFTEKEYKIIEKTDVKDRNGQFLKTLSKNLGFNSLKLAYVQDRTNEIFDTFEYLIGFEDNGWISTDSIILADSEMLPDSIVTTNKKRFEKKWIPVWYNEFILFNKNLNSFSNTYKRFIGSREFVFSCLHNLEFRNVLLSFNSIYGEFYFSINKISKDNNLYNINCEIAKKHQISFNEILKNESFENLPDLTEKRDTTFIIEQNGNRLRVYNGENYKLIIELMPVNKEWADKMRVIIKSCG